MPKNLYFSQDEYERRWKAVYDSMAEKGYETAVIWGKTAGNYERHGDLLYLTNYYSNLSGHSLDVEGHQQARSYGAVILHRGQEPELIMDMPSFDMDQLAVDNAEGHTDPIYGVTEALKRLGVEGRTALIGTDFLPMKYAKQMEQQSPAVEWMPEDELVREVRQVKSDQEVELYRNAGHTMTEAISRLMEGPGPGQDRGRGRRRRRLRDHQGRGPLPHDPRFPRRLHLLLHPLPHLRLQPGRRRARRHGARLGLRRRLPGLLDGPRAHGRRRSGPDPRAA